MATYLAEASLDSLEARHVAGSRGNLPTGAGIAPLGAGTGVPFRSGTPMHLFPRRSSAFMDARLLDLLVARRVPRACRVAGLRRRREGNDVVIAAEVLPDHFRSAASTATAATAASRNGADTVHARRP